MQYIFVLGRNRVLSIAEILSIFRREKKEFQIIKLAEEILFIDLKEKLINSQDFLDSLGGTIKIIEVFEEYGKISDLKNIFSADTLLKKYSNLEKQKLYWGLSIYFTCRENNFIKQKITQEIQSYLMATKEDLRQRGKKCRIVTPPPGKNILDAPAVRKNNLLAKGGEIIIIVDKNKFWQGKTVAVQNFHFYEARDFGRPARDMKIGMMPPKLAQIMINLSETKLNETIIDPFCGTGVILQEAFLMGYKTILGTDKDKTAIDKAIINMKWFVSELNKNSIHSKLMYKQDLQILQLDANEIAKKISSHFVNAIITEGTLGPRYSRRFPNNLEIKNNFEFLEKLYLAVFIEFKKIIKINGKIVISFPAYIGEDNKLKLAPFVDKIVKLGYNIVYPVENAVLQNNPSIVLTNRGTTVYSRPDQIVGREIVIFIKN